MTEINFEQCCYKQNLDFLDFETTADLHFKDRSFVLQKNASEAITLGLKLDRFGYNIFCSGNTEAYKRHFLRGLVSDIAKNKPKPNDFCYVFNPENKYEPILLAVPAGMGKELKREIDDYINKIDSELISFFKSTAYRRKIETILQKSEQELVDLHEEYNEEIKPLCFTLIENPETNSLYPVPIKKGKPLTQEEFDSLPDRERDKFIKNKKKIDLMFVDLSDREEQIEINQQAEIEKLDAQNARSILRNIFGEFSLKYAKYISVISYKENIVSDVIRNVSLFKVQGNEEEDKIETVEIEGLEIRTTYKKRSELLEQYKVNLLVDNSSLEGAPVIFVDGCLEEEELFGCCKFEVSSSTVSTDFTQIVAGELLKANGGYLIIDIDTLFYHADTWEKLKTVLKNKKLKISTKYYNDVVVSDTLKPEPIDIDVKVILLGDFDIYSYLKEIDDDFSNLFRVHAVFEDYVKSNNDNLKSCIYDICYYIEKEKLLPFSKDGIQEILRYLSREAENQNQISLNLVKLHSMIDEADIYARTINSDIVTGEIVNRSHAESLARVNFSEEDYKDLLEDNIYMFEVEGSEIGIINGLSVSDYSDFSIGRPLRITCNTYKGEDGIISVDRSVELTGPIHDKAIEIIKGCVGSYLAQKYPLSINISLSFEQLYGGLEGDSATCAEIVAIFSSIFNKPIKQNLAITGSMNQKGQVQAIGGVNEKIEGFFNACKILGRNNQQGVVIPKSNIKDLMLSEEVVEAIRQGTFHIYSVSTLEEVLEIMMGLTKERFKEEISNYENKIEKEKEKD